VKRRILYSVLGLNVVAALVLSWATQVPGSKSYDFFTALATPADRVPSLTVPATIVANDQVPVFARTSGVVTQLFVHRGDNVKKGQLLVAMDASQEDLELYAMMVNMKRDMDTVGKVRNALTALRRAPRQGYPRAERQAMENEMLRVLKDYLTYDSLLDDLKKRSTDKFVFAPLDGTVAELNPRVGDRISAERQENPVATIAPDLNSVNVELFAALEIPEEAAARVRVGQKVAVNLPFSNEAKVGAWITEVSTASFRIDKRRYFPAIAKLKSPFDPASFRYGMKVLADVDLSTSKSGVWVPLAALELKLPPGLVHAKVDATRSNQAEARSQIVDGRKSTAQPDFRTAPTTRNLANKIPEAISNKATIFLLTHDSKVIETLVSVVERTDRQALVDGDSLSGLRVVTHVRRKDRSISTLLSE
jgi:multidrug efflux pump subunit AcrA (membrane-fusion protein)